jgi:hypothetical protein
MPCIMALHLFASSQGSLEAYPADLSPPALQKRGKICATVPPVHTIAQAMQCSARAAFRIVWELYALSHIEKPSLILRGLLLVARLVRLTHLCLAIIR